MGVTLARRKYMAFNNLQPASGPFFLAPGQAARIWVLFGDPGDDHGAQWIMAHPLEEQVPVPASLTVSEFTKERGYTLGIITVNGPPQYSYGGDTYIRYWVTVTNTGSYPVHFNVQGGGNT
jgi:hypothetical protein